MIKSVREIFDQRPNLADFVNAVFFGLLSVLFGFVKINVPGVEGISADFREIPLLIAIFYLRSLWPVIIMCGVTVMTPSSVHFVTVYFMHLIGLVFAWLAFNKILHQLSPDWRRGLFWAAICVIYYLIFIIPLLILIGQWIEPGDGFNHLEYYVKVFGLVKYEFVVTTIVTTMYLIQFDVRNKLREHERTLETQVEDRTNKLATANLQLKRMNENLDEVVIERSLKIKEQLNTIEKYVNMNSHQLRVPLSNILGLANLLKEKANENTEQGLLVCHLDQEARALDDIIKEMNKLLENEMQFHSNNNEIETSR